MRTSLPEHILVTGGAGFIGSHIVDAFLAAGHAVTVVDNLSSGKRGNVNPRATFYQADIRDAEMVAAIFAAERPAVVCHQAALADVRASLRDPAGYAQVNVIGTLNLLEAARAAGTVRTFLFASSGGAVYGEPDELPVTEQRPTHPLDPYGASKLAGEAYLFTYARNYGLTTCALRYANVYGPRQDSHGEAGVVAIFAGAMLAGRPVVINGDGRQSRDFVYVEDVVRANLLAVERGNGVYNIGTGVATDIVTIADEVARLTGVTAPRQYGPAKAGEVRQIYLDAGKAGRELGWQPRVPLPDGLIRTVTSFRHVATNS